jgi:hypothetical protein
MYVTLRAWRANEGGTTDLHDYSETVPRDRTLFETQTTNLHYTPQWHIQCVGGSAVSSSRYQIFAIYFVYSRLYPKDT